MPFLLFDGGAIYLGLPARSWPFVSVVAGFSCVLCPVVGAAGTCGVSGVEDVV